MDRGTKSSGFRNGQDCRSFPKGSSTRNPSPPTLPAGDEFALFMNAALLGLKERGVEVMTTPASDGWGMSAIKGQRLIEVAVGDTPEAAARDLFLRLILKGIK